MEDKQFECALWGTSWDEALAEGSSEQGVASFSGNHGIRLEIPFGEVLPSDVLGQTKVADYLYGFSRNGDYLVLKGARSHGVSESFPGGKKQNVSADCILKSRKQFDPDIGVQSVTLRLKGLREWVGEAPITAIHYGAEKKLDVQMDIDNAPSIVLHENNPRISIEHCVTTSALTTKGINMGHDCLLSIRFEIPRSIEDILQNVIQPTQSFLSFCIGKHASIMELKFRQIDAMSDIDYYSCFVSSEKVVSDTDNMPLSYHRIKNDLSDAFSAWLNFEDDLERGSSLLVSLLTIEWKMPIDLQFLAAAQMLETLARYKRATEELSVDVFENYLAIVSSSIEDEVVREWVLKKLEHSNYVSQRKLLKDLLDDLGEYSDFLIQDKKRFLNNHLLLRNAYTHRSSDCESPKLLKGGELYWHMQAVLFLSYGAVLMYLKYTPEEVVDIFTKSSFEWYKIARIKELYSKKTKADK